uniref:Uncharacterized protein n=1 Tax=Oryza rufipogon TaxID=4529 RepID=A0A0E0N7K8_ORYRU
MEPATDGEDNDDVADIDDDDALGVSPGDLAFTIFVPSPESFHRVLRLRRPKDSVVDRKADDATYAVISHVLGFSIVPLPPARYGCSSSAADNGRWRLSWSLGVRVWAEDLRLEKADGLSPLSCRRGLPHFPLILPAQPAASPLSPAGAASPASALPSRRLSHVWEEKKDDGADRWVPHFSSISLTCGTHILSYFYFAD